MRYVEPGLLTTNRIERSQAKWGRALIKISSEKASPPSELAIQKARSLNARVPVATVEEALSVLPCRTLKASSANTGVKLVHDAYASDERRRVYVVASELAPKDVRRLGTAPVNPDSLARRVKLTSLADTFFFELRKHRLRLPHHAAEVAEHLRKPKVKFTRRDLVIVDTRNASHHAVATVVAKAKKAKATLLVITDQPVIDRARERVRGPQR